MGMAVELTAKDGHTLSAYRAEPAGTPKGGVVVLQEIFGVGSHIRNVTDGFAADGYLAVAPAVYDRIQRGVELPSIAESVAEGRALRAKVSLDLALLDIAAAVSTAAAAGRVGLVGYCWGGFLAWHAAARVDGLACVVSYYGAGVPDAKDLEPRCPVLLHFGERDAIIPVDAVRRLATRHPSAQVHIYPADHGFNCDERGSYDAPSARLARERTLQFFAEHMTL